MLVEHWVFIVVAVLLLVSELLGLLTLKQYHLNQRYTLFRICVIEGWLWLFFNLLELLATTEQWTVIFMKLSFIPLMLLAPTLTWLAHIFVGEGSRKWVYWLFVPPGIFAVFMLTNDFHFWFWHGYEFIQYGPLLAIETSYNALFYAFTLYTYLMLFFGVGMLLANLINIAEVHRTKASLAIITLGGSLLWSVGYVMRIIPLEKDFSPIVYNFVFLALIYAAIRHGLFNIFLVPRQYIFNHMHDGVIIFNHDGRILDINDAARSQLMLDETCVGEHLETILTFWDNLEFKIPAKEVKEEILLPSKVIPIGESPDLMYLDVSISHIGYGFVLMLHDVTDIQRLMIQIEEMANFDSLTELRNRRSFFNMVEGLTASAKRNRQSISVMLLDIDDFKQINDHFGHVMGDRVLKLIADYLKTSLRAVDVKARYGGDEFIILLPQTRPTDAELVANKLFEGIKRTVAESELPQVPVSFSIGISGRELLSRSQSLMELVEEADKALYAVKNQGKGFALNFTDLK